MNKYIVKKILLTLAIFGLLIPLLSFAARTDALWDFPNGSSYYKPNGLSSGVDLLIFGSNHYLNWGSVSGTNGYGIRDNSGSMEFKNSGGSWAGLGTGGGSTNYLSLGNGFLYTATSTDGIKAAYFVGTSTTASSFAGNVGIGTTTPVSPFSVVGELYQRGNFAHFGPEDSNDTTYCVTGKQCLAMFGNDNTLSGVNIEVGNNSTGTSAYSFVGVLNDLADSSGTHYSGISLNGSKYNDNSFGSAFNIPNVFQMISSDGPSTFINSTSTANISYFNWVNGGSATSNEKMRLTSTGDLGIGTTTPSAKLAITGTVGTADVFAVASSTNTRLFTIKNTGNVGIGNSSPSAKLDVNGNIKLEASVGTTATNGSNISWIRSSDSWTPFAIEQLYAGASANGAALFRINNGAVGNLITVMTMNATGIGLGVTPTSPFHLVSTATGNNSIVNQVDVTGSGSAGGNILVSNVNLNAGYTGVGFTRALSFDNASAGTNNTYNSDTATYGYRLGGNVGAGGYARGVTTGHNAGGLFLASGGDMNYGLWGAATVSKNSATNIGVFGTGLNGGTSPVQVGGYFTLLNSASAPVIGASAALIADNGSQTSPIFLARDNGTTTFSIVDGGNVGIGTSTPSAKLAITGTVGTGDIFAVASSTETRLVTVKNTGSMGIGTSTPQAKLHIVDATVSSNQGLRLEGNSNAYVDIGRDGSNGGLAINSSQTGVPILNVQQAGTSRLYVGSTGSIGISTTSPIAKLDIYGTAGTADIFGVSSSTNSRLFTITNGGNVGIGTSTPTGKLHIASSTGSQLSFDCSTNPTSFVQKILTWWHDCSQNQMVYNNGTIMYQGGNIYTATAGVTLNSATPTTAFSATKVGTTTISANTLRAGQKFTIWGAGYYSTPIGNTSTITVTPSIASSTATNISTVTTGIFPASATNLPYDFRLNCTVRSVGVSGTLVCDGTFNYATALTGVSPTSNSLSTVGTIAFDSTVDETLDVKVNWSAVTTQTATVQESWIDFQ